MNYYKERLRNLDLVICLAKAKWIEKSPLEKKETEDKVFVVFEAFFGFFRWSLGFVEMSFVEMGLK